MLSGEGYASDSGNEKAGQQIYPRANEPTRHGRAPGSFIAEEGAEVHDLFPHGPGRRPAWQVDLASGPLARRGDHRGGAAGSGSNEITWLAIAPARGCRRRPARRDP